MKLIKQILALSVLSALSSVAFAQTSATANFQASATLSGTCLVSVQSINFGTLGLNDWQGSDDFRYIQTDNNVLRVRCSSGLPYSLKWAGPNGLGYNGNMIASTPGNNDILPFVVGWSSMTKPENYIDGVYSAMGTGQEEIDYFAASITHAYVTPDTYVGNATLTLEY